MNLSVDAYWSLSGNIVHVEYGIPIEVDENKKISPIVSEWNHTLEFSPEDTILKEVTTADKQLQISYNNKSNRIIVIICN
ncbi:hypothetical protein CEXT_332151 [Caerostris extrusa]|uniref:Uncharacterized protein n=1 Tax=Caerostris extrusa TaxID=172846 RepID=A0AAV4QHI5_CAEEX|nr:hypothetical protein CEXT_332151 [Caerostris extrusa]